MALWVSRPLPVALWLPKAAPAGQAWWQLVHTRPAWMARPMRSARLPSRLHTPAPRPSGVSLAVCSASASSWKVVTASTGPKISSRNTRMLLWPLNNQRGCHRVARALAGLHPVGDGQAIGIGGGSAEIGALVVQDPTCRRWPGGWPRTPGAGREAVAGQVDAGLEQVIPDQRRSFTVAAAGAVSRPSYDTRVLLAASSCSMKTPPPRPLLCGSTRPDAGGGGRCAPAMADNRA